MKIDGSLARNNDFEVANLEVHKKTCRETSILKLQIVKIGASLARNARFDAPTCLVSSLWFSCGLAVSMGEAADFTLYIALHSTLHTLYFTLLTPHFTLHTLHSYTPHSTLYTPHSTLHTVHSTLHTLHFTLHTLHFTLYTPHVTLYAPHSTHDARRPPHSPHYTLHSALYSLHSTPHTLHSTLYTLDFTLHTLHSTLCTLHFTLYTLHSTLYTPHVTLYTPHSTLCTPHITLQHSTLCTAPSSAFHSLQRTGTVTVEHVDCSNNLFHKSALRGCIWVRGLHIVLLRRRDPLLAAISDAAACSSCVLQRGLCKSHCNGCVKVAWRRGCARNTIVFCSWTS